VQAAFGFNQAALVLLLFHRDYRGLIRVCPLGQFRVINEENTCLL